MFGRHGPHMQPVAYQCANPLECVSSLLRSRCFSLSLPFFLPSVALAYTGDGRISSFAELPSLLDRTCVPSVSLLLSYTLSVSHFLHSLALFLYLVLLRSCSLPLLLYLALSFPLLHSSSLFFSIWFSRSLSCSLLLSFALSHVPLPSLSLSSSLRRSLSLSLAPATPREDVFPPLPFERKRRPLERYLGVKKYPDPPRRPTHGPDSRHTRGEVVVAKRLPRSKASFARSRIGGAPLFEFHAFAIADKS